MRRSFIHFLFHIPVAIIVLGLFYTSARAEDYTIDLIDTGSQRPASNVVLGDIDGDGALDLIAGNAGYNQKIIYHNDGAGKFQGTRLPSVTDSITTTAALGDLDNDGALDLVLGHYPNSEISNQLQIYHNVHGTGEFTHTLSFGAASLKAVSIALGDVTGDGALDIIVGNECGKNQIYKNKNNNTGMVVTTTLEFGNIQCDGTSKVSSIALGDIDGDNFVDIVVGINGAQNQIYFNDNNRDGKPGDFSNAPDISFGGIYSRTTSIALGDLDANGSLDIVATNTPTITQVTSEEILGPNEIFLISEMREDRGQTTDFFRPSVIQFGIGYKDSKLEYLDNATSVALADVNGDGQLDILIGNANWKVKDQDGEPLPINERSRIYTYDFPNKPQRLDEPVNEENTTWSVAVGDLDGDGTLDIIAGNTGSGNSAEKFTGTFKKDRKLFSSRHLQNLSDVGIDSFVAVGDLNNDAYLDIVNGNEKGTYVSLNDKNSPGNFLVGSSLNITGVKGIALGNLNGIGSDGKADLDLVIAKEGKPNQIQIYLNKGGPNFFDSPCASCILTLGPITPTALVLGDLDGNSLLDLVVGYNGQLNHVYFNDGGLNFSRIITLTQVDTTTANQTKSLALGDLNGDGALDIVAGNNDKDLVYLNKNDGHGAFFTPIVLDENTLLHTFSIAVGDIDGDGTLDIVDGNEKEEDNYVYYNQGEGTTYANERLPDLNGTCAMALGDLNGDETTDMVCGVDLAYLTDKKGQIQYVPLSNRPFIYQDRSVALGDLNSDGLLDIIVGGTKDFVPAIFINTMRIKTGPTNNPPGIHIKRPGYTPNANFYSTSEILSNQFITIPYTLFDNKDEKVGHVLGQYSLDGGGNWITAISTTITATIALTTSQFPTMPVQHAYVWNTQGIFGQPQNVVFRLKAIPQAAPGHRAPGEYRYPNGVAGSFMWAYAAATTFPFRIGGTQVQVLECVESAPTCKGVANALVYRKRENQLLAEPLPLQTNAQGFLGGQASLHPNDQLMALLPVTNTNYVTFTNKYSLYYTSGEFKKVSETDKQELIISASNKLLLFKLNISLEWDAHSDTLYQSQLEKDLKHASEFLYDWTNGQAALGQINLYFDRQNWDKADIRVYANNRFHPNADQGGVVTSTLKISGGNQQEQYDPGQVRIGALWNRYGDNTGSLGEDWPKALAHELGHYLLFLDDNYFGFDQTEHFVPVRSCRGAMFDPYRENESEFYPNNSPEWRRDCENTFSNYTTGRSDWATIDKFYPYLVIPIVAYSEIISGPNLALNVTKIVPQPLDNPRPTINTPLFNLVKKGGGTYVTSIKTRAILFQANQLVDLGRPVGGEVLALGAHKGDKLCVFELEAKNVDSPRYWGCQTIVDRGVLEVDNMPGWWPPEILIHSNLKNLNGEKMNVTIEMRETIPGSLNDQKIMARLYPDNLPVTDEKRLEKTAINGVYTVSFPFTKTVVSSAYVHVCLGSCTPAPTYEIVTDYTLGGSPGFSVPNKRLGSAPAISADGHALLYFANLEDLEEGDFFSLQAATVNRNTPSWFTPIGHAYRLIASRQDLLTPGLDNSKPNMITGTMILNYLGNEVPGQQEKWLVMYYKDDRLDAQWEPIRGSTVISDRNYVAAPLQGPGFYALMATIEMPKLKSGWEEFSYPDTDPRPVPKALASIKKAYTSVYRRDGDRWLLYDRTARPELFGLVNYNDPALKLLEMKPFESYWIYVLNDTIPYIGIPSGQELRATTITPLPPATFYGWVEPTEIYTPRVGDPIIARIDNKIICGVGEVQLYDQLQHAGLGNDRELPDIPLLHHVYLPVIGNFRTELPRYVYKMQILSDTGNGCGVFGREISFEVGGKMLPSNHPWGNSQACYHPLGKPTPKPYQCFTFATPDLVVSQLNVTPNNVEVVIKNRGSAPVPPGVGFWVDVYINPARRPEKVNETWQVIAVENRIPLDKAQGLVWSVRELKLPLEPGQTMTFTIGDPNYRPVYSNFLGVIYPEDRIYAHVDSANDKTDFGGVLEGHEMLLQTYNNIRAYPVEVYFPLIVKND